MTSLPTHTQKKLGLVIDLTPAWAVASWCPTKVEHRELRAFE